MSKKILFFAFLVLYPVGNIYPMTVHEAVKQALRENPDLQDLRLEKEVAQGRLGEGRTSPGRQPRYRKQSFR